MDSAVQPWVRDVTLMTGTQVAKTETLNNIIGFHVRHDPCPTMLVMARADDAKLAMQKRLMPMVNASPALRAECTDRVADLNSREMTFRRCILYLRAAQSAADLASVPVRVALCDEVDKWPTWTGREAAPLSLLKERTRTFYNHLIVTASTPTTRRGLIWRRFQSGDQRRYWMQCGHCQKPILFEWPQVDWPDKITTKEQMDAAQDAWYECQECGGKIDDRMKRSMIASGWWVPDRQDPVQWRDELSKRDRCPHRSYHMWAAYSPWIEWWKLVSEFLDSDGDPEKKMNWVNSWLAELWEDQVQDATDAGVRACVGTHNLGDVPSEALVITGTVDVQVDRLEYHVNAWGRDEESWIVAAGATNEWEELADILFRNTWGEQKLAMRGCLVDSRYRRSEVLDFARRWPTVVRMIAGVDTDRPNPFGTVKIDKHPKTGQVLENSMTVWTISVGWFKDLLAGRIQKSLADPGSKVGRLWLPSNAPDQMKAQLASEHKVRERSGNREVMRWVLKPGHQRNEAWDLQVYQAAAARMFRVDTLRTEATAPRRPAQAAPPARPGPPQRQQQRRSSPYPSFGRRP